MSPHAPQFYTHLSRRPLLHVLQSKARINSRAGKTTLDSSPMPPTAGQAGSGGYLTLRRLIVWLAEPQIRMRGLAGIADAVAHLEGGALINAVDALAQHGDSLVQHFVSRTLQQMCQPLFQMAREWVFDGRLNNAGAEFFVSSTGVCFSSAITCALHKRTGACSRRQTTTLNPHSRQHLLPSTLAGAPTP